LQCGWQQLVDSTAAGISFNGESKRMRDHVLLPSRMRSPDFERNSISTIRATFRARLEMASITTHRKLATSR
jgi:hypothetical protein